MTQSYYEAALLIFLFQGISFPFVVLFAYIICLRQWRRLQALQQKARASAVRLGFALSTALLPKFRPLNCPQCGAGMLLETNDIRCVHCQHREAVPKDYQRAVLLKNQVRQQLKSALRAWRLAWVLTSRPVVWFLGLLLIAEPIVLIPIVLVGSEKYPHTRIDDWLAPYQSTGLPGLVGGISLMGGFTWWLGLAMLAGRSNSMRTKLPVFPVRTKELRGSETANCQSCGGAIQYDRGDFATICSYCHVENYRVQFARTERHRGEQEEFQAKFALFDALSIVNEFLFTIWIFGAMCVVTALLIWLKILVWKWLGWA